MADEAIDWDTGFWSDSRSGAFMIWHCRAACEAGRTIPLDNREGDPRVTESWREQHPEDAEELQSILDEAGIAGTASEEMASLTADIDGGASCNPVIVLEQLGTDAANAAVVALYGLAAKKGVNKFNELRKRRGIRIQDERSGADITDVPPEAIKALEAPPPTSGELVWDQDREIRRDLFDKD